MKSENIKPLSLLFFLLTSLLVTSCRDTDGKVEGTVNRGILDVSSSSCIDDALNVSSCSTAANRYVTDTLGANITSYSNTGTSITASIPTGFYMNQNVSFTDANLVSANIRSGVSVFGVAGTHVGGAAACTDNALNAASCSTAANRYVTATAGANVTGAAGSLSATIPAGYYSGSQTSTMSDADLVASNIKSGVDVFGVTGNYSAATGAIILEQTVTTNGTGTVTCTAPTCTSGYTSLGCAYGDGGGASNSASFGHSVRAAALTDAITNNFASSCTRTFTSASTYNKATCLRLCTQ